VCPFLWQYWQYSLEFASLLKLYGSFPFRTLFIWSSCWYISLISTRLIFFLSLIMVLSFVMSLLFKSLNAFSTYRNVNEYAMLTLFSSSKEYKTFVSSLSSGLFWDFASLLYSENNELRLSKYSLKSSFSISSFFFYLHFNFK